MIFNLRGTNGTGKSTVAHMIIHKSKALPIDFWPGAHRRQAKPRAYAGSWRGTPIVILGSYATVCGGMDTITDINDARDLIIQYGTDKRFPIVFYEGLFISHCLGTVAAGLVAAGLKDRTILAYLDTPLKVCLERVYQRRQERGITKPFKEQNVVDDYQRVEWNHAKATREGWRVVDINHIDAQAHVESYLDKEATRQRKQRRNSFIERAPF
jgi:hypothetical protein